MEVVLQMYGRFEEILAGVCHCSDQRDHNDRSVKPDFPTYEISGVFEHSDYDRHYFLFG